MIAAHGGKAHAKARIAFLRETNTALRELLTQEESWHRSRSTSRVFPLASCWNPSSRGCKRRAYLQSEHNWSVP